MAVYLTRSDWRVLRSAVYPIQWIGLMMICCGMAVKGMGMLGVIVREMNALTVKMATVTLIDKGS
jgi:hypothetical protein